MNSDEQRVSAGEPAGKAVDVALAEFNALRSEILMHVTTQAGLVGIGLTVLGVIVGLVVKEGGDDRLLLGIPPLAAVINLLYAAETHRTAEIGSYIEIRLWPYLKERVDPGLPSWEQVVSGRLHNRRRALLNLLVGAPALVLFPAASVGALVVLNGLNTGLAVAGWVLTAIAILAPLALGAFAFVTRGRDRAGITERSVPAGG
jgi:hypothetical protein